MVFWVLGVRFEEEGGSRLCFVLFFVGIFESYIGTFFGGEWIGRVMVLGLDVCVKDL